MTNIIKKIKEFISYWYFRYQLATELYMVEPWEKSVIHVCYFIIFGLLSYINSVFVLSGVSSLRRALLPSMTS